LSVLGRGTRPFWVWRKTIAVAAVFSAVIAAAGCGAGEGVAKDAVVTAYVEAPLCVSARQELQRHGGRAGDLRVQAICLPNPHEARKLKLATLGANARRATEDSTTVAYLEASDPRASRFTHPILATAEIPWISSKSGAAAISRLLELIESSDSSSLRESLRDALNQT
jgi:hypothetical protein